MAFWVSFIGYQAVWFVAVSAAGHARAWPGIAAAALFVLAQLLVSSDRRLDYRLLAAGLALGMLLDGLLAATGWIRYAAASPALPPGGAPLWILGVWAAFATTVTRSMGWLRRYPLVTPILGAIGGPLAYVGAAKGWGALAIVPPNWRAELTLGLGWAGAMPLLFRVAGFVGKES